MKHINLTITFLFLLFSASIIAQSKKIDKKKILYTEYHPATSFATEYENDTSLLSFINKFEQKHNINLQEIYQYPMTSESFSYFFTLSELTRMQQIEFIAYRSAEIGKHQVHSSMSRYSDKKKHKLKIYIDAIPYQTERGLATYNIWDKKTLPTKSK